jgi:hypothetical protein
MALPSTNIGVSDIFYQANPGASGVTDLSFLDIASVSYFSGPNGSNVEPYNYWGESENSGANRIYGTIARAGGTDYPMGDFLGLTYFYDNSSFLVKVDLTNNLPPNAPFPPPPTDNNVSINATLFDSTFTYQYGVAGGSIVMTNGGTFTSTISQTTSPIIFRGYWKVEISPSPNLVAGALVDISINGSAKVTNGTINAGPTPTSFDSATYGTEDVAYNATLGGTGLLIVVTCHT